MTDLRERIAERLGERIAHDTQMTVRDLADAALSEIGPEMERLRGAIIGLIPSSRSPDVACWCPLERDKERAGHSEPCKAARKAFGLSAARAALGEKADG